MRSAYFQWDKGARFLPGDRAIAGSERDAGGRLAIFEKDQDAVATGSSSGGAGPS
jgi:hypothetical protein